MKFAKEIPAVLLGLVFFVFGLMFFLKMMPTPPMEGVMADYMKVMGNTGYITVVKVLEITIGLLLLIPKTRPLAMILIAPIIVNILLFELLVAKAPGIGVALTIINIIGLFMYRRRYAGIIG